MASLQSLKKLRYIFAALLVLILGSAIFWKTAPEVGQSATAHEITLSLPDRGYTGVKVIGDFTGWQTQPLAHIDANWTANFTVAPSDHSFGLYIDDQWRIVSGAAINGTILTCQSDKAQYVFGVQNSRSITNSCNNIPRSTVVTVVYKSFAATLPKSVHILSSLNDWQEVPTTATADGLFYVTLSDAHFTVGVPSELGAIIDGQWYSGDHLFANQTLLTCINQKGLLSFTVDGDSAVRSECDNVPHRANLTITYVAKSLEKTESVQILGSFNAWTATTAPLEADQSGRYTLMQYDIPTGTQHLGLLVNGQWQANPGVVLINGSLVSKITSSNQLEFCLTASGAVQDGSCPQ